MKKILKNKTWIIGLIIILVAVGFWLTSDSSKNLKVPYPFTRDVSNQSSFACESLVSSGVISSPEKYLTNGVEGSIKKGTDKVAVEIKNSKELSFITGASVESGAAEGASFTILKNTDKELIAILYNNTFGSVNVFSLDKEKGLGVWSKTRTKFPSYGPTGNVIYMICR